MEQYILPSQKCILVVERLIQQHHFFITGKLKKNE